MGCQRALMLCHKIGNMRAGGAVLLVPDSGTKFPPSDTSTKPYFQAQLKSAFVELFSTNCRALPTERNAVAYGKEKFFRLWEKTSWFLPHAWNVVTAVVLHSPFGPQMQ